MIRESGEQPVETPGGTVSEVRARLYTFTFIQIGDEITYDGVRWRVIAVPFEHLIAGNLGYYDCPIMKLGYSTS